MKREYFLDLASAIIKKWRFLGLFLLAVTLLQLGDIYWRKYTPLGFSIYYILMLEGLGSLMELKEMWISMVISLVIGTGGVSYVWLSFIRDGLRDIKPRVNSKGWIRQNIFRVIVFWLMYGLFLILLQRFIGIVTFDVFNSIVALFMIGMVILTSTFTSALYYVVDGRKFFASLELSFRSVLPYWWRMFLGGLIIEAIYFVVFVWGFNSLIMSLFNYPSGFVRIGMSIFVVTLSLGFRIYAYGVLQLVTYRRSVIDPAKDKYTGKWFKVLAVLGVLTMVLGGMFGPVLSGEYRDPREIEGAVNINVTDMTDEEINEIVSDEIKKARERREQE